MRSSVIGVVVMLVGLISSGAFAQSAASGGGEIRASTGCWKAARAIVRGGCVSA